MGEFIALYEQAQDYVVARAKEAGQIPPGARSDEVIFEFGRRVEGRVKQELLTMGRQVEELEEEISIWRSFMVPEPVRGQRWRQEVSREVCGNE